MDRAKILSDQLDTIIAEAGKTEKYLKAKLREGDRVIKNKEAEIHRLNARLANFGDNSTPLNLFGKVLNKLTAKFGFRKESRS